MSLPHDPTQLVGQRVKLRRFFTENGTLKVDEVLTVLHTVMQLRWEPDAKQAEYAFYGREQTRLVYTDGARTYTGRFVPPLNGNRGECVYIVPTSWEFIEIYS
jgi:hypothetical protein